MHRTDADRISPSPGGLKSPATNRSSVAECAPPEPELGGARPCREHQASIVRFRPAMITIRIGLGCLRRDSPIESIDGVDRLLGRGTGRFGLVPRVRCG